MNEQHVSTDGAWTAFETTTVGNPTGIAVQAVNIVTGAALSVVSNGFDNERPNISGNLMAYESDVLGNSQVSVYRIDTGQTFQATNSTFDEHLNDINGNLLTYVDNRSGSDQIYDSVLTFAANVSSDVRVTGTGLLYSRVTRTFNCTLTATNTSGRTLAGPVQLALTNLTAGVTLVNATGTFSGSPFVTVRGVATLAPGQSASVALELSDPSNAIINFTPVMYSGGL